MNKRLVWLLTFCFLILLHFPSAKVNIWGADLTSNSPVRDNLSGTLYLPAGSGWNQNIGVQVDSKDRTSNPGIELSNPSDSISSRRFTPGRLNPSPENFPPEFTDIPQGTQEVTASKKIEFIVVAEDSNPDDTLTITLQGKGTLTTDPHPSPDTGFFQWVPSFADTGTHTDTFIVTDGEYADTGFVIIKVNPFQDPYDPYEADTLYFTAGGQHSADGDTLYLPPDSTPGDVAVLINFWNDNQIKGFTVPLTDGCYGPPGNAYLASSKNATITPEGNPVCFAGSRVEFVGWGLINLVNNPPDVLYGMVCTTVVEPGNGLFATMVYSLSDTATIYLDTVFFPPENELKFVLPGGTKGYRPVFRADTFHTAWRPNEGPVVSAPQRDSVAIKDSVKVIFSADDPDNDSLLHMPEIEIIPDCGVFHVERTDTQAYSGTWELTWSTATGGCVVDTYYIVMRVEDKYGATGEDTTEMIVWKPNHPPQIVAPDTVFGYADTVGGYTDTITFSFSAFDPDSDVISLFQDGFWPPSCANTISINQTSGVGTHEGVWEVVFREVNCDPGTHPDRLDIAVEDERSEGPGSDGWADDTIVLHLDLKPSSPPVVDAPDETLSVWIDYELSFTFFAADPDSHKLLDSASISVIPFCGDTCQYWVERLWGSEGPSGEWQVQFNAYRSDSDYYSIILDVKDDHDSTGYDTVVVHVYPRPNYNPDVFAPPTTSAYTSDTVQYIFTASDPDSNKLLDVASITVMPDCGSYFAIKQAGPHFFAGTWKLTFYTFGCTVGVYDIIVDVKDIRDGVGYDTTAIMITDRPNAPPTVVAPIFIEGLTGQVLNFDFTAVDPDTDVILDLANLLVTPNCGVSFANRTTGIGTYSGIWQVTFNTAGCAAGDYEVYMEVQDAYGKIGYDVTLIQLGPSEADEEEAENLSVDRFALNQNYPNPFNLCTEISFQLPVETWVSLKIYNTRGQLVRSLIHRNKESGVYSVNWDGKDEGGNEVASGIYFYKLTAGNFSSIRKMVLIK